jgi:hypothetical protein
MFVRLHLNQQLVAEACAYYLAMQEAQIGRPVVPGQSEGPKQTNKKFARPYFNRKSYLKQCILVP